MLTDFIFPICSERPPVWISYRTENLLRSFVSVTAATTWRNSTWHICLQCVIYTYIYYNGLILHAWQLILFELAETQCLLTLTEWLAFCKMCADQPAKEWWLDRGSCLCQVRNGVDLLGTLLITAVSCFPIQLVFHDLNWLLCSVFCGFLFQSCFSWS